MPTKMIYHVASSSDPYGQSFTRKREAVREMNRLNRLFGDHEEDRYTCDYRLVDSPEWLGSVEPDGSLNSC